MENPGLLLLLVIWSRLPITPCVIEYQLGVSDGRADTRALFVVSLNHHAKVASYETLGFGTSHHRRRSFNFDPCQEPCTFEVGALQGPAYSQPRKDGHEPAQTE